jgi:hypothetical protein
LSHTVEIQPPSVRAETLNVLKAAGAVVVLVAAYIFRPQLSSQSAGARPSDLLPFQNLVRDASPADQRMFRELREGLLEAERIRATSGTWPEAARLAEQGIPPFASDPTRKDASYRWTTFVQNTTVNYLGIPSVPTSSAWLLVIIEPESGAPPDPAPNDETHHRLPDGTTLHVSIWHVPENQRRSGLAAIQLPQNEGWTQLMVGNNGQ